MLGAKAVVVEGGQAAELRELLEETKVRRTSVIVDLQVAAVVVAVVIAPTGSSSSSSSSGSSGTRAPRGDQGRHL